MATGTCTCWGGLGSWQNVPQGQLISSVTLWFRKPCNTRSAIYVSGLPQFGRIYWLALHEVSGDGVLARNCMSCVAIPPSWAFLFLPFIHFCLAAVDQSQSASLDCLESYFFIFASDATPVGGGGLSTPIIQDKPQDRPVDMLYLKNVLLKFVLSASQGNTEQVALTFLILQVCPKLVAHRAATLSFACHWPCNTMILYI